MKLKYTQTNAWTFDLFFLLIVPIMKKKVQSSSSKAGFPRMCNREGQDCGLGKDAEGGDGELPALCVLEARGLGVEGADVVGDSGGRGSPGPSLGLVP